MAAIDLTKLLRGRPTSVTVLTAADAEVVSFDDIKDGLPTLDEEIKTEAYEIEDGREIETDYADKVNFEFVVSEFDTTDILAIRTTGDKFQIASSIGGTNNTGMTLEIDGLSTPGTGKIRAAVVDGGKTKISGWKVTNSVATLPYSLVSNAV